MLMKLMMVILAAMEFFLSPLLFSEAFSVRR